MMEEWFSDWNQRLERRVTRVLRNRSYYFFSSENITGAKTLPDEQEHASSPCEWVCAAKGFAFGRLLLKQPLGQSGGRGKGGCGEKGGFWESRKAEN